METIVLPQDLGEGLVARCATRADAERMARFQTETQLEDGQPDPRVGAAVRGLLEGRLHSFPPGDFTVIEDTRRGIIVSSLCLVSERWSYAGIPILAGQPEFVATHPDFRNRGLVRKQFEIVHGWSRQRGQQIQGITGIPYFYRQFGYEMAVDLDGGRVGYAGTLPHLPAGGEEPFVLRPALEADIPLIAESYEHGCRRSLLVCLRDERDWRYEIFGRDDQDVNRREFRIIVRRQDGQTVGYVGYHPWLEGGAITASYYELRPGISWLEVTPSVMRYLWETGESYARAAGIMCRAFALMLGEEHPAYRVMPDFLPRKRDSYAWYMRVPDLPGFLRTIAPVLEQRLIESDFAGQTLIFTLDFYRGALSIRLENGRLAAVESIPAAQDRDDWAGFPGLSFLQLVLGYRAVEEIEHLSADCWMKPRTPVRHLLNTLFPKKSSTIWPVI